MTVESISRVRHVIKCDRMTLVMACHVFRSGICSCCSNGDAENYLARVAWKQGAVCHFIVPLGVEVSWPL
jgi:hypothetical protein